MLAECARDHGFPDFKIETNQKESNVELVFLYSQSHFKYNNSVFREKISELKKSIENDLPNGLTLSIKSNTLELYLFTSSMDSIEENLINTLAKSGIEVKSISPYQRKTYFQHAIKLLMIFADDHSFQQFKEKASVAAVMKVFHESQLSNKQIDSVEILSIDLSDYMNNWDGNIKEYLNSKDTKKHFSTVRNRLSRETIVDKKEMLDGLFHDLNKNLILKKVSAMNSENQATAIRKLYNFITVYNGGSNDDYSYIDTLCQIDHPDAKLKVEQLARNKAKKYSQYASKFISKSDTQGSCEEGMLSQYLLMWDHQFKFKNSNEAKAIIKAHIVDPKTPNRYDIGIRMTYKQNTLVKLASVNEEKEIRWDDRSASEQEMLIRYEDEKVNESFHLDLDSEGLHVLGGEKPDEFSYPSERFRLPYQYLGLIKASDPAFTWVQNDLHLIYPFPVGPNVMYLDYTHALKPKLMSHVDDDLNDYPEIPEDLKINIPKQQFSIKKDGFYQKKLGLAGVPKWVQNVHIPICPKSGNYMKFLLMLRSQFEIPIESSYSHIAIDKYLNFNLDGCLYIFYDPDSKVMAYFIQNT